jgi:hypothetical protein
MPYPYGKNLLILEEIKKLPSRQTQTTGLRFLDLNSMGQIKITRNFKARSKLTSVRNLTNKEIYDALCFLNPRIAQFGIYAKGIDTWYNTRISKGIYYLAKLKNPLNKGKLDHIAYLCAPDNYIYEEFNDLFSQLIAPSQDFIYQ